jgi:hypothetical protein
MFHQPDLFEPSPSRSPAATTTRASALDLPGIIERIAGTSRRPRYAFMVLNLIAKAAGSTGGAGPYVREGGRRIPVRDWLCDALIPMAQRDPRRRAIIDAARAELEGRDALPLDEMEAKKLIDTLVRERVRRSGRCNISRAVSDLVRAGLIKRHYQGYRVNHHNRGAQREVVYTIADVARVALRL